MIIVVNNLRLRPVLRCYTINSTLGSTAVYPPSGLAGAAGGIGDPAAAAVRRKRRRSRPMSELVHPSGFQPCTEENRSETTQTNTHNRLNTSPPPANNVTNVTYTQHHPHPDKQDISRIDQPNPTPETKGRRTPWGHTLPVMFAADTQPTDPTRTPSECRPGDSSGTPTRGQLCCLPQNNHSLHRGSPKSYMQTQNHKRTPCTPRAKRSDGPERLLPPQ